MHILNSKFKLIISFLFVLWSTLLHSTEINNVSLLPDFGTSVPVKNESRVNNISSTKIKRISDYSELEPKSNYGLIVYSRYSPTNTSGEYVLVHHSDSTSASVYRVADSKNLGVLRRDSSHPIGEVNEIRWDYSGKFPDRVYFVHQMGFYQMDIISGNGTPKLIYDFSKHFPNAAKIMNDVEGDSSSDSRYWAWQVLGKYENGSFPVLSIITFDKLTNTIIGTLKPEHVGHAGTLPKPNMVEISPLGTKVITHYGAASTRPSRLPNLWNSLGNGVWLLKEYKKYTAGNSVFSIVTSDGIAMKRVKLDKSNDARAMADNHYALNTSLNEFYIKLPKDVTPNDKVIIADWGKRPEDVGTLLDAPRAWDLDFKNPVVISADETHSGWAFDAAGKEWFVSQNNKTDWIEARDIRNGSAMNIIQHGTLGWSNGFHFMKPYNLRYKGWILFNTLSKKNIDLGNNKILAVELKTNDKMPDIRLISPKFTVYDGKYRDESPVALGYDGKSIWYTSNWGKANNSGDVYQQVLPDDWQRTLPSIKHLIYKKNH
jgi:hypothetical protein